MKAFLEITSGVIRIGPTAVSLMDDFEIAVAMASVDGKTAILKGLSTEKKGRKGRLKPAHVRAAIRLMKDYNLKADWIRKPKKKRPAPAKAKRPRRLRRSA